ncbi:MAG TPA: hypothetical protein VMN76_06970 [Acidobacteriota bacterium]|nr:hypothetical protein [Acidobacteriota bacterium]
MIPQSVVILDQALRLSLWTFIAAFLILLLFASWRIRKMRRRMADVLETEAPDSPLPQRFRVNEWRTLGKALAASGVIAALTFVIACFVPLPSFYNFASGTIWERTPLRVTSMQFERFYEGFSLDVELWNQTGEALPGVEAIVTVRGAGDEVLDRVSAGVNPNPLPAGQPGSFRIRYAEKSPLIRGYQLSFLDQEGEPLPHVTGLDSRK